MDAALREALQNAYEVACVLEGLLDPDVEMEEYNLAVAAHKQTGDILRAYGYTPVGNATTFGLSWRYTPPTVAQPLLFSFPMKLPSRASKKNVVKTHAKK